MGIKHMRAFMKKATRKQNIQYVYIYRSRMHQMDTVYNLEQLRGIAEYIMPAQRPGMYCKIK